MTPKFTLREWEISDSESLVKHANDPELWNYLRDTFPKPYTLADAEKYIMTAISREGFPVDFAIECNGEAVGAISIILGSDVESGSAEIGYWIGREYWNKGIMNQAVRQMAAYAFTHFEIHKLFATVFSFNIASQKVLEKAGFEKEAVLKQAAIKNNRICDIFYYALFGKQYGKPNP